MNAVSAAHRAPRLTRKARQKIDREAREIEALARAARPFVPRTPKWPSMTYFDDALKRAIMQKVHRLQKPRWRKIRYQFAHLLRFLEVACRS